MTAGLTHASPARTPEACSSNLPATARPGAPPETGAPPACAPPRPRRPAWERPLPRGLRVGPASCSRSLPQEQQQRSQPSPAVTYRCLMVPQRLSPGTVLTNRARQLRASSGSQAGPHSEPFKHRRARPAGIATPWASCRAPPSSGSAPRMPAGGGPQCVTAAPPRDHRCTRRFATRTATLQVRDTLGRNYTCGNLLLKYVQGKMNIRSHLNDQDTVLKSVDSGTVRLWMSHKTVCF